MRIGSLRGSLTWSKNRPVSVLRDKNPFIAKTLLTSLVIIVLIGSFLSAALLVPFTTDGVWDEPKSRTTYTTHSPIIITGDAAFTRSNGVVDGEGTGEDPYVIENWEIDASRRGYGVMVSDTTKPYVIRNIHVIESELSGILLSNAPNGTVEACLLEKGGYGLVATGSDHIGLFDNTVTNHSRVAVEITDCEWVSIVKNRLQGTGLVGISLNDVRHCTIGGNEVLRAGIAGISVFESSDVEVIDNAVSEVSRTGVDLEGSTDVLVCGNSITMSGQTGLSVQVCAGVSVFHNTFVGTVVHALSDTSTEVAWNADYPTGGNYWAGHSKRDVMSGSEQDSAGADGIGDLPYVVCEEQVDRYPWVAESMSYEPAPGPAFAPV